MKEDTTDTDKIVKRNAKHLEIHVNNSKLVGSVAIVSFSKKAVH